MTQRRKKEVWGIFEKGSTYYSPPEVVIDDVPSSVKITKEMVRDALMLQVKPKSNPWAQRQLRKLADLEVKELTYFAGDRPIYRVPYEKFLELFKRD